MVVISHLQDRGRSTEKRILSKKTTFYFHDNLFQKCEHYVTTRGSRDQSTMAKYANKLQQN